MTTHRSISLLGGLLAAGLVAASASAADLKDTARAVYARAKDAVITVTAVVKMDMRGMGAGGRGSEGQPVEACGTVIGADGLLVTSSSMLNPISALLENLESTAGEERLGAKPKVELTQVKYRLADGTEVPARLVYNDKDLDLAFLVPDLKEGEKAPQFTPLELKASASAKELDDIIVTARLAKKLSYTPAVMVGNIVAVVIKPRTLYDFAVPGSPIPGVPVFNAAGELLGLTMVHRDTAGASANALAMSALGMGGNEIIILPAAEVSGLVDQARKAAARKPEKKEASGEASASEKKEKE